MKPVFDLSFAWPTITGAKLVAAGAGGVIGYAGCLNTAKNVSKARFQDWLDSGLMVGLVVEDIATDAIGGEPVGQAQGKRLADAADALGYDVANCVLFGGYDTDAHPGDYNHLVDYMNGFHSAVPVPGYYGDSDSIDFIHRNGPRCINWQSASASFSPKHPSPNTHLQQRFADPRAHGLDVDVNDVLRTPLLLMGEDMPHDALDPADVQKIERAIFGHVVLTEDGKEVKFGDLLRGLRKRSLAATPDAIVAAVLAKLPDDVTGGITRAQVKAALDSELSEFFGKAVNG